MEDKMTQNLIKLQTAAERIGVTYQHLRLLAQDGAITVLDVSRPGAKRRALRVDEKEIERFLETRSHGATS
jgi:hypothetical protein